MSPYCAKVLSPSPARVTRRESDRKSDVGGGGTAPSVKMLLITEKPDGFLLRRFTEDGNTADDTLHETLDDAMRQAYSEYESLSDWRFCPDDVDPLDYLARSDA